MRSLKSGLVAFGFASLFVSVAVVGCSADGGSADLGTDTPATEPTDDGAQLPPPSNTSSGDPAPATDAGTKKDSGGKTDAAVDAGPPPPAPGDSCTTVDALAKRPCGACGTQEAICQASGDAGALAWSDYGQCQGELAGGCTPGTVVSEACGNCGTVQKTCTKYCAWTSGSCTGQPTNSCAPGAQDYSAAGCSTPNTYRNRTCGTACTWSSYSGTCAAPNNANKMTISATPGQVVTQAWTLSPSQVGHKPNDCGAGNSASTTNYQYVPVEIRNTTAQKATVTIYQSKAAAAGSAELDMVMWVYNKTLPATDDASLVMCDYGVEDYCTTMPTTNLCGNVTSTYNFAGLSNITINANSAILVYSAGFSSTTTGAFNLNVKTDSLQ